MLKYVPFILAFLLTSCVEDYNLDISSTDQHVVVEGLITNNPSQNYVQNYVRLTYSVAGLLSGSLGSLYNEKVTPENNAIVTISDDLGNEEKLTLAPEFIVYTDTINNNIRRDTFSNDQYQKGFYYLTNLKALPGHTYYLKISLKNKEYHSQCFMPPLPKIDSISFDVAVSDVDKYDYHYIPRIYFQDPADETNYYLFKTGESKTSVWGYSILNDKLINGNYINGLDIFHGQTNEYWMSAYPRQGDYYTFFIQSLTKEGYDYYNMLIQEFNTDGGTYKPTPASPKSNIDNGALGFFRASSSIIFKGQIPY